MQIKASEFTELNMKEMKKWNDSGHICKLTLSWKAPSAQIRIFLKAYFCIFFTWIGLPSGIPSTHETSESFTETGWFSNRTGTSVDDGKARGKDWTRLPVLNLLLCFALPNGQHSLTSVERPSYLRLDFVNVWCHARLEVWYVIHLHFDRLYPTCLIFGERFCPTFSIIPRLIPINSNKKMPLPPFKGCFDVSSLFLLRGEKDLSVDVTE